MQNPAEFSKVRSIEQEKIEGLLGELDGALEKLGLRSQQVKSGLQEARGDTLKQRKVILAILEAEKKAAEIVAGDDSGDSGDNGDETIFSGYSLNGYQ